MSTQFYATLDEIIHFVDTWITVLPIWCTALSGYDAESVVEVTRMNVRQVLHREDVFKLVFSETKPDLTENEIVRGLDVRKDVLVLLVGRLKEGRCLEESHLSTLEAQPVWKKILREIKKLTRSGAIVRNEESGAVRVARARRCTEGAFALAKRGIAMKQRIGSPNVIIFE